MPDKRIADLFAIRGRFLRSANLERDFYDPAALSGYVPTEFAASCIERIGEGLRPRSGQRAWRMTGDYGSGKSSLALVLAHTLAGHEANFPPQLRRVADLTKRGGARPRFLPVLVTCSREPLGTSILRGLRRTLADAFKRGGKHKSVEHVERLLNADNDPDCRKVVEAVLEANARIIAECKGQGLLLIIDELGKFLEFAAFHPQRQDVFLLQQLAEAASHSGEEPLFVVCLLHQGFNAYADQLDPSAQREWEKVAGRFDEIVFSQPVEQVGQLIACALGVHVEQIPKTEADAQRYAMRKTAELGWFGPAQGQQMVELAARMYPLHPTVLPALIRAFRRFGQNERSLFSFLLSNEPFGLQAFAQKALHDAQPYRLHDLFDYIRVNFGHRLVTQSYRSHWNLIDSTIETYATEDPLQTQVLKTVGVLNLLNDDLLATEESVVCALADDDQAAQRKVRSAIERLRRVKRVLYDRGRAAGLCLWPHTSVDLEKAYDDARRALGTIQRVAGLICDFLETRPVVARRHYIETGNLRHFEVRYCPVAELPTSLEHNLAVADGVILVPLCETEAERQVALAYLKQAQLDARPACLVAVPQPLSSLAGLVQEVQRWDWVASNTPQLNGDKYAREEVSRQRQAARAQLERRIQSLVGFKQFGERANLDWFHLGQRLNIRDGRHLLEELSRICDETYSLAPRIHNELVNRRSLSSAAAAARMRLIERMFSHGKFDRLGMDLAKRPPEMSMYLSVLRNTGIHQPHAGTWRIAEPEPKTDAKCRVLPAFRRIREVLQEQPDKRVNLPVLFDELRKPPYGVRDGLAPLLLTAFALAHEQDVAFYKDGSFLREMSGEAMLVLTKAPERFDIQYCKIEGVRLDLFEKLLAVLEIKPGEHPRVKLLDVVRPLCVFVAQLPAYVLNTKKLSTVALAVRDTILKASSPAELIFTSLPKACGFEPFAPQKLDGKDTQAFVKTLKAALDELRAAYPLLQERLRQQLRSAFDLPGSFQEFRTALAGRSERVVLGVTEPKLRAFCLRLMDDNLPESEWLESLGNFLALKPPAKWYDAEEGAFAQEIGPLATRFHHVESIVFAGGKPAKHAIGIRLAITQADGSEHEQVVHFTVDEEQRLRGIQKQFESLLTGDRRLGLAAASRALWAALETKTKPKT